MPKIILILSVILAPVLFGTTAAAVTGNEWQAGRIIDDSVFTDKSSMTVQEIQNFLNSKLTSCDTNGEKTVYDKTYGDTVKRSVYATRRSQPVPFTCLKDYYEVPKTTPGPGTPANNYGGTAIPAGAKSSAQIIWDAAQAHNISPKVLLVTLQKEQALVTDDWPLLRQFTYAMGSNCPDGPNGAECDPDYAGFSIQMYSGAKLFRNYLNNMTQPWWPYKKPYQDNHILWNVQTTNCGGSNVYIGTASTAALYTYTPYQPNKAALDNLYGTGDGCSAYGNRNFWRMFSDWFVTPYGDLFNATMISPNPRVLLSPGQSKNVSVTYRNTGQWTWHDDNVDWPGIPPLRFMTSSPQARNSMFAYGWYNGYSPNAVAKVYEADGVTLTSNQHIVNPGQIITYTFPVTAPWGLKTGVYTENFKPVLAGTSIDLGRAATSSVIIDVPPIFRAENAGQSNWPSLTPGESVDLYIKYRNTGQYAWRDEAANWPGLPPVQLNTGNANGVSIFSYSWPSRSVAAKTFHRVYESDGSFNASSNQHVVQPGQIAEFKVTLTSPWNIDTKKYIEYFKPVLLDSGVKLNALTGYEVSIPAWKAKSIDPAPSLGLKRGNSAWVCVRYQNKGAYTWHDKTINWPGVPPTVLMTANSNNQSIFSYLWTDTSSIKRIAVDTFDSVYTADGTLISPNPHTVKSNQIARFCFVETTPWGATQDYEYTDYIKPALKDSGVNLTQAPDYTGVKIYVPTD